MATEAQYQASRQGAGSQVYDAVTRLVTFTVNGNTTLSDASVVLPAGSIFRSITLDTPTAITGTPTSCLFRAGTAAAGQQIVADVDAKAQGHIATTIVAALDKVGGFSAANTTVYMQVVTSGGTSSAGPIYALVSYDSPAF